VTRGKRKPVSTTLFWPVEQPAVTVPLVPHFVLVEDAGADDVSVLLGVTTAQPARAVGVAELLAVPDEAPDDDIEGLAVRVEDPSLPRCIRRDPGTDPVLDRSGVFPGVAGQVFPLLPRPLSPQCTIGHVLGYENAPGSLSSHRLHCNGIRGFLTAHPR